MTPAERLARKTTKIRKSRVVGTNPRKRPWKCCIRETRQGLRLAMHEVAAAVGLCMSIMSEIERGSDPMLTTARKLADFYGKTIEELWPKRIES